MTTNDWIQLVAVVTTAVGSLAVLLGWIVKLIIRSELGSLRTYMAEKYVTKEACKAIRAECAHFREHQDRKR